MNLWLVFTRGIKFGLLMTVSLTDYVQGLEGLWLWLKVRVTVSCKVYG